jgi:biotin operon repressor
MNRGYVKVWRKIEDSGLIQLPNTLALFMHLLLRATHKDTKRGTTTGVIELKRGQYISGIHKLSEALEQTERQIRTSIDRLTKLGIITVKATNKYSVYTIENYNLYQDSDTQNDKQTTSKEQSNDKETTTKQELNNLNIKEIHTPLALLVSMGISESMAKDWLSVRKLKKLAPTKAAFTKIKNHAEANGYTFMQAVTIACENSWAGFNVDWVKSLPSNSQETPDWKKGML